MHPVARFYTLIKTIIHDLSSVFSFIHRKDLALQDSRAYGQLYHWPRGEITYLCDHLMRGCLISTGCKAAVPGGNRKRGEKSSPPTPNKTCRKQKTRKISEERLSTRSAPRTGPVPVPVPVPQPVAGSLRLALPRCYPGSPARSPPQRCLWRHRRSGAKKILIKQSPPRNGCERECGCWLEKCVKK